MPLISALIVAYNPKQEFKDCLDSMVTISENLQLEIIVVDNASTNGFLENIIPNYPQVTFIHSDENRGFGGGNNLGFEHSTGEYILCANPDLVMNEDALSTLLQTIQSDPSIGIVGPKTMDPSGELVSTARADYTVARISARYLGLNLLFPHFVDDTYRQQMQEMSTPFEADWLQGSCLLMRRETYAAVKGFDEDFFLYLEDTDICTRVHQLGLKIVYVPQAIVSHVGGATTSKFHGVRVKSYHHSPIHYHRKQGNHLGVGILKLVFTLELGAKIIVRTILNLLRPDATRKERVHAEMQTLRQVWLF